MGNCIFNENKWCEDFECIARCKLNKKAASCGPDKFEGFKCIMSFRDHGEYVVGMANFRGDVIIATNQRVVIHDPRTGLTQEVTFKPEVKDA